MATERKSTALKKVAPGERVEEFAASETAPSQLPRSVFSPEVAKTWDRLFNAAMAKSTAGLDPRVILLAYLDWWVKLAWSPGTHARLTDRQMSRAMLVSRET